MPRRQPLPHIRRKQKRLITVDRTVTLRHDQILSNKMPQARKHITPGQEYCKRQQLGGESRSAAGRSTRGVRGPTWQVSGSPAPYRGSASCGRRLTPSTSAPASRRRRDRGLEGALPGVLAGGKPFRGRLDWHQPRRRGPARHRCRRWGEDVHRRVRAVRRRSSRSPSQRPRGTSSQAGSRSRPSAQVRRPWCRRRCCSGPVTRSTRWACRSCTAWRTVSGPRR